MYTGLIWVNRVYRAFAVLGVFRNYEGVSVICMASHVHIYIYEIHEHGLLSLFLQDHIPKPCTPKP